MTGGIAANPPWIKVCLVGTSTSVLKFELTRGWKNNKVSIIRPWQINDTNVTVSIFCNSVRIKKQWCLVVILILKLLFNLSLFWLKYDDTFLWLIFNKTIALERWGIYGRNKETVIWRSADSNWKQWRNIYKFCHFNISRFNVLEFGRRYFHHTVTSMPCIDIEAIF